MIKYLVCFFAFIVVLYIPFLNIWIRKRNDKANIYRRENPNAVKVYIERTELNDLLTVWQVNDKETVMFSEKTKTGFYLLEGENIIDVAYQWTTVSITNISGYETHTEKNVQLKLTVKPNKEYSLSYDHVLKKYKFVEKRFRKW
jgi:hypothetical protein